MIIIIIRFSVDAPLHREYPHKLIFIINRAIRNVAQVQKRRVCKNFKNLRDRNSSACENITNRKNGKYKNNNNNDNDGIK